MSTVTAKGSSKRKTNSRQNEVLSFMFTENSISRSLRELETASEDTQRFLVASSDAFKDLSSKSEEVRTEAQFTYPLILNRLTKAEQKEAVAERVYKSKDSSVSITRKDHKEMKRLLRLRSTLKAKDRASIDQKISAIFNSAS